MSLFVYEARDKNGTLQKGKIQASDSNQAADKLMRDHLIPIHIQQTTARATLQKPTFSFLKSSPKIPNETLMLFCRQMYSLDKAGVPILSSIKRLSEITNNTTFADILKAVLKEIGAGASLSKALESFPSIFPPLLVSLIKSGEANGRIDEALLTASKHYELEKKYIRRMKSVLRYPLFVIAFAFAAIMLISIFVIPKFAALYKTFNAELPLPTRMLIGFASFVQHDWWIIVIFISILSAVMYYFLKQPIYRIYIDRFKMNMPIFGHIVENIVMASFAHNFAMLLQTGLTVIQALNLVSNVVDNAYAKEKIVETVDLIRRGKNLSQASDDVNFLSPMILQVLSVAEKTGSVDKMLLEISESYEQEIEYDIKRLADKIEPLLIVSVGLIVLLLALGVFLPMWSLAYNAK